VQQHWALSEQGEGKQHESFTWFNHHATDGRGLWLEVENRATEAEGEPGSSSHLKP